ncbi:MAG: hypothetical protein IJQ93_10810 [Bacteroidales bacterium]|nr:hypothetical protein [Bacteroidales bacterium]
MKRLDAALGHPWKQYPSIHVAGTNGKGSVCSMLAAALAAGGGVQEQSDGQSHEGLVGLYTSPHLLDFRERMKIIKADGYEMISREEVWEFLEDYESVFEGLSFFEITTGMALWWFARRKVDAAVIEVGLGGRLDSTNIITPAVSVVTSIGLDHCALLGSTRAQIAREKAGIFKPGIPAVVSTRDSETAPVFEDVASAVGAPLTFASDIPVLHLLSDEVQPDSRVDACGDGLPDCDIHGDGQPDAISEKALLALMDLTGPCQDMNLHTSLVALDIFLDLPGKRPKTRKVLQIFPGPSTKTAENKEGPTGFPGTFHENSQKQGRSADFLRTFQENSQKQGRSYRFSRDLPGKWSKTRKVLQNFPGPSTKTAENKEGPTGFPRTFHENSQKQGRSAEAVPAEETKSIVKSLCHAAAVTGLRGRWERVSGKPEVICDIGHNPPALKENFAKLKALQSEGRSIVMVYGMMADKDLGGIAPLIPPGTRIIATAPQGQRSLPAAELARRLHTLRPDLTVTLPIEAEVEGVSGNEGLPRNEGMTGDDVQSAVQQALILAQDLPNPLIYIGGSAFTVAEALPLFNEKPAI